MASEQPIPMEDTQYDFATSHPFSSFMKEKNVGGAIKDKISLAMNGLSTPGVAPGDASGTPAPAPAQASNPLYEAVHPNTLDRVLNFASDFGKMFLPGTAEAAERPSTENKDQVPAWFQPIATTARNPEAPGSVPVPERFQNNWLTRQIANTGLGWGPSNPTVIPSEPYPAERFKKPSAPLDLVKNHETGGYALPGDLNQMLPSHGDSYDIPNQLLSSHGSGTGTASEAPIPAGRFRVGNEAWRNIPENYESPSGKTTLSTVNTGPQAQPMLVKIGGQAYSLSPDVLNEMAKDPGRYTDQGYYGAHPEEKAAQDAYDLIRPPGENSYEGGKARMREMNLRDIVNNPNSTKEARLGAANQLSLLTKDRAVANTAADAAYTKILGQGMEFGPQSPLSQERIAHANYYNQEPEVQRQWHTETAQARVEAARERAQARMEESKDKTSQKREKDQLDLYNRTLNRFKTKTKDMMSGNETEDFDSEKAAPEIERLIKAGKLSEDFRITAPEQSQMASMPSPGEHKGRTIRDTQTGKRFKSDGKNWVEMK